MNFNLFHNLTKELQINPEAMEDWPSEWKETQYKVYTGAQNILLSELTYPLEHSLVSAITGRTTKRDFDQTQSVSLKELSTLFKYSLAQTDTVVPGTINILKRNYPSAGARYPLETYLYVSRTNDASLPTGLYHCNIKANSLELLDNREQNQILEAITFELWAKDAPVMVFITGTFERTMAKYGLRGYRFILQEVGHTNALFSLVGEALNLSVTQIGATDDELIESFLDIDGTTESILSVSVIGKQNNASKR